MWRRADRTERAHAVWHTGIEPDVIDPDIDLHDPYQRAETERHSWDLLAAIALGGVAGSEARYGLGVLVPHARSAFPWSSVLINAGGSLLIGVLMVLVVEVMSPHRLVRPFLGVGVLGGFTTYSTFAADAQRLVRDHRPLVALGYVLSTLALCFVAVLVGTLLTRLAAERVR